MTFPFDIRKSEISAVVAKSQSLVVESQQMQDRRVQIVHTLTLLQPLYGKLHRTLHHSFLL